MFLSGRVIQNRCSKSGTPDPSVEIAVGVFSNTDPFRRKETAGKPLKIDMDITKIP